MDDESWRMLRELQDEARLRREAEDKNKLLIEALRIIRGDLDMALGELNMHIPPRVVK